VFTPWYALTLNNNHIKVRIECSKDKKQAKDKQVADSAIASEDCIKAGIGRKDKRAEDKIPVKVHKRVENLASGLQVNPWNDERFIKIRREIGKDKFSGRQFYLKKGLVT
jgi:hypothetical protein